MAASDAASTRTKPGAAKPGAKPNADANADADTDVLKANRKAARARRRQRRRSETWKRLLLRLTGWFFIFLGILGLVLPILQGILFLLIGMVILGRISPRVRKWRMWARRKARERYPSWTGKFEEAEVRGKYWIDRILKTNRKKA